MALSTLLEIVTRACDELSLPRPTTVISSTDPQVRTFLAHAQAAGRDLMRVHDWGNLVSYGTCSTTSSQYVYLLTSCNASDFDRLIADSMWDTDGNRFVNGPDNIQTEQGLREGNAAAASISFRFRLAGNTAIRIWPTPSSSVNLVFPYISNKWARSSSGTALTEFASDTDTTIFDADLMKAEIKWRFLAGKGMNADAARMEAVMMRSQRVASDIGGSMLNLTPGSYSAGSWYDPQYAEANWDLS